MVHDGSEVTDTIRWQTLCEWADQLISNLFSVICWVIHRLYKQFKLLVSLSASAHSRQKWVQRSCAHHRPQRCVPGHSFYIFRHLFRVSSQWARELNVYWLLCNQVQGVCWQTVLLSIGALSDVMMLPIIYLHTLCRIITSISSLRYMGTVKVKGHICGWQGRLRPCAAEIRSGLDLQPQDHHSCQSQCSIQSNFRPFLLVSMYVNTWLVMHKYVKLYVRLYWVFFEFLIRFCSHIWDNTDH